MWWGHYDKGIARVHLVYLMNTEQHQGAAYHKITSTDLCHMSTCRPLSFTHTIAILHYSAWMPILIYHLHLKDGRKWRYKGDLGFKPKAVYRSELSGARGEFIRTFQWCSPRRADSAWGMSRGRFLPTSAMPPSQTSCCLVLATFCLNANVD